MSSVECGEWSWSAALSSHRSSIISLLSSRRGADLSGLRQPARLLQMSLENVFSCGLRPIPFCYENNSKVNCVPQASWSYCYLFNLFFWLITPPLKKVQEPKKFHNFWHWFLALFTKLIKNLGVPEMTYCENLLCSKNCRWNRVKMVKNRPKTPEIILGTSLIININIFNIFCFSTFSFQ